jgi:hypothetical protein
MASAERPTGRRLHRIPVRRLPQGGRYQQQPSYEPRRTLLPPLGAEQAMRRQEDVSEPARPAFVRNTKSSWSISRQESPARSSSTPNKLLFLGGMRGRCATGVGRPGFTGSGRAVSARRNGRRGRLPEMLARPDSLHMEGTQNPLGARAMYLGSSLYRIHGSKRPWTSTNVRRLLRMRNEDVDLYGASMSAPVVVI